MKVTLSNGDILDVKTGQARRLIQAGEATEATVNDGHDEKPRPKARAARAKSDDSADAVAD